MKRSISILCGLASMATAVAMAADVAPAAKAAPPAKAVPAAQAAAAATELDGPLVDFERKGTKVELAGTEVVEGRNTYKLKLTLKGGEQVHLWIDAKSFLETKIDGEPRRMDGRMRKVAIFSRDFKPVGGLQFPHTIETVVESVKGSHKMTIQTIKLKQPLDDTLLAKPQLKHAAR